MAHHVPLLLSQQGLRMNSADHEIFRSILEALPLGVYFLNRESRVALWSAGAERLTGYLRQDVLGRLLESDLFDSSDNDPAKAQAAPGQPNQNSLAPATVSLRCKNGHYLVVHLWCATLRDESGRPLGTVKIFEPDAPSQLANRRQDKLGAYGCLDPITGVLNHSMIQAHVKESLNLYALYPVPFCVLSYEVDNLRKITERYGQAAMDAALRMVANTFENGLRPTDFLGHWQGHEFLAILPECGENDVMKVSDRLRKSVERAALTWWGDTLHATVSVGATVVHDSDTVSTLLARAEQALRQAAESGGNRVVLLRV